MALKGWQMQSFAHWLHMTTAFVLIMLFKFNHKAL